MPGLNGQIRMKDRIHLYGYVCGNRDDGSEVKDPAKEVQCTGEETKHPAVPWSRSHRGPVVDASRRWYAGSELEGHQNLLN